MALGWFLLGISLVVFAWLIFGGGWSPEERKRSVAILVLFMASALFWASFEQAGSTLSLFAERSTDRHVFGFEFPASWFQFVQPIFVVALAPVFAWLWLALNQLARSPPPRPSSPWACCSADRPSPSWCPPPSWWLTVLRYPCGGSSERIFCKPSASCALSPVGLSAMTKLAPERAAGFMMGIWFLSTSIGNWLAGEAASFYSSMPLPTLFGTVAALTIGAAVVLALLIKPTVRMMSGVK